MGLRKRYFSARSVATDPIHGPVPDLLESLNLQPTKVRGKLYKLKMPFYSLLRAIGTHRLILLKVKETQMEIFYLLGA